MLVELSIVMSSERRNWGDDSDDDQENAQPVAADVVAAGAEVPVAEVPVESGVVAAGEHVNCKNYALCNGLSFTQPCGQSAHCPECAGKFREVIAIGYPPSFAGTAVVKLLRGDVTMAQLIETYRPKVVPASNAGAASVQQVAPRPSAAGMFGPSGPVRHQPGRGGHYAAPAGRSGRSGQPGHGSQQDVLAQVMLANVAYVNMMTKRASQPKKPP